MRGVDPDAFDGVAIDLARQIAAALLVCDRDIGYGPMPRNECVACQRNAGTVLNRLRYAAWRSAPARYFVDTLHGKWRRFFPHAGGIAALVLFAAALVILHKHAQAYRPNKVRRALRTLQAWQRWD
jgi:hypothetical protein